MIKLRAKTVLACLAVSLLISCSSTRLTYNYLDWIIDWYLDDYLSLNSGQEDFYRQRMDGLLKWHRRQELIRYSRFLTLVQQDLRGPLSASLLQERYAAIKRFGRDIMERAAPECAELLILLDQGQRRTLYAALAKKQKKLEGTYRGETANERTTRQVKLAKKTIERFTGGLTDAQKALLVRWAEALAPVQHLWLKKRLAWQQSLRAVLEGNDPNEQKRSRLRRLFVDPQSLWPPAYRRSVRQNEAATLAMLAELLGTLTTKQQKRLHAKLEQLKQDFHTLSRQ